MSKVGVAIASFAALVLIGVFHWAFRHSPLQIQRGEFTLDQIDAAGGNTQVISELIFSEFILPFELTSILLLGALVGVVAVAMRQTRRKPVRTGETGGVY